MDCSKALKVWAGAQEGVHSYHDLISLDAEVIQVPLLDRLTHSQESDCLVAAYPCICACMQFCLDFVWCIACQNVTHAFALEEKYRPFYAWQVGLQCLAHI